MVLNPRCTGSADDHLHIGAGGESGQHVDGDQGEEGICGHSAGLELHVPRAAGLLEKADAELAGGRVGHHGNDFVMERAT